MAALGYSINTLTLFALVLAVGIVVDDAIVVVENAERHLRQGASPKEAARRTMDEVGGALISIALVLTSVFIPTMFLDGISGEFFRQFAVAISVATLISAFNSLTLSPALAGLILKSHEAAPHRRPSVVARLLQPLVGGFNVFFDALANGYASLTRRLIRFAPAMLALYAVLIAAAAWVFVQAPRGFVPAADQGYLIASVQLPPGASLQRSDAVVREVGRRAR
jgi:HAE1 family hydrophobic/amphiphilic exporter-1